MNGILFRVFVRNSILLSERERESGLLEDRKISCDNESLDFSVSRKFKRYLESGDYPINMRILLLKVYYCYR